PFNPLEGYHYPVPQVALGYLSTALKKSGFNDILIKDALLEKMTPEQVESFILNEKPDLIGIRVWSHQLEITLEYIRRIRSILPNVKIVIGGPHPTVAPESLEENFFAKEVDIQFAFAGEAEEGFPKIVRHIFHTPIDLSTVPGLVWKEQNQIRINPLSKVENLDQFEIDWDALNLPLYHKTVSRTTSYDHQKNKNAFLFMTRGCPYPCTYCAAGITNGKKIRSHSPERILDDIEYLYKKYDVRHFNLMDDNFTFYRETVLGFCDEFEKRRARLPGITFHNPNGVRVDRLDKEMLLRMKACGWQWLHIGLESGSNNTLKKMRKRLDLKMATENISLINETGLKSWGFFMIGFLEETKEDIEETIQWAIKSKLNAATFSIFSPIPGTAVFKEMQSKELIPKNYMMSGYMSPKQMVFAKDLNAADLQKYQRNALIRFYKRPDRALHLLRGMDFKTIGNRLGQLLFAQKA
ncbi:MAG: B12-binding domain-containing radical SAM protein, partial [Oligoflexia bacterium]|nr:B12-binding domain-containing radical SAM protein [Oligoflexia bacterium]